MELTAVALFLATAVAGAPAVPLEKITDSSMLPPGVTGEFFIGSTESCLGNVFYTALDDGARIGLYAVTPQGLMVIANTTTPIPGLPGTFQNATRPTCAGNRLLFLGDDDLSPMSTTGGSIYSYSQGTIELVFEVGTPIGSTHFTGFDFLAANGGDIVVDATLSPPSTTDAIVLIPSVGAPVILADLTTVLPGQTNPPAILSFPILVGPDVVFHGRTDANIGIYRWREGEGLTIAGDTATPVPLPGQGNFGTFRTFTNLGGRVVFEAGYLGGVGLFAFDNNTGGLEPVILPGAVTADGATLVEAVEPTGAGELLSFLGRTVEDGFQQAIFVKNGNGPICRTLGVGDIVEGHEIHRVETDADHRDVLLWAADVGFPPIEFIYRLRGLAGTDIPTLSSYGAVVLGIGLALSGWLALRRR